MLLSRRHCVASCKWLMGTPRQPPNWCPPRTCVFPFSTESSTAGENGDLPCNIYPSRVLKFTDPPTARPYPTVFTLPGVSSQPFYDGKDFSFAGHITPGLIDSMRSECINLRETTESDYKIGDSEHSLHGGKWEWHSYMLKGEIQNSFKDNCPITTNFLENITELQKDIPFAYSFFSTLMPNSDIEAHCGPTNLRLRCHLPLIVPSDCGIVVAGEAREWKEGELMVFDDAYEHYVFHKGTSERLILLFDIWHPDVEEGERAGIVDMFVAAKQQGWLK